MSDATTYLGGLSIPTVLTERLALVGMTEAHLDDLTRIAYDPRVAEWFGGLPDPPHDAARQREEMWRYVALFLGHWAIRGHGQWAVVLREGGRCIGRAGLWQPEGWPGLEVGWMVDPAHQRRGYATEAAVASIDFAFAHLHRPDAPVEEVISITVPHNAASRRVMEKAGLVDTGRRLVVRDHEQVLYRTTRETWDARRRGAADA